MRTVSQLIVIGVMVGSLYGLIGFTITLMFRSTGVLSFAHAGFALAGSYMYAGFSCPPKTAAGVGAPCAPMLDPWPAAIVAIGTTAIAGILVERLVMRPLALARPVTKAIATAAVLGLASGLVLQIFGNQPRYVPPSQQLVPQGGFELAGVVVDWQRLFMLAVSVGLVAVLGLFLHRSWFGLGVRAAGQRPEVARLMGIRPAAISRFNWALGGALSGLAGVLIAPITVVNIGTFSFLLVKAVAAALIGGLVSLPLTFAAGIALGLVEAVLPHYWPRAGVPELGVAVLVVAALFVNRHRFQFLTGGDPGERPPARPPQRVPLALAVWIDGTVQVGRRLPRWIWLVAAAAALSLPLRSEFYGAVGLNIAFYALVALSLMLSAGSTGQPSLMQMSFVGLGAYSVGTALNRSLPFLAGVAIGVVLCFAVGWAVGQLAARFRGAEFAILTLTIAAVITEFVLTDSRLKSSIDDPRVFGWHLLHPQHAFVVMAVMAATAFWALGSLRRSSWGRSLLSLREDTRIAPHFGINAVNAEAFGFAVSAGVAGLAGGCYALIANNFGSFQFVPLFSIVVLLAAVVGGLRSLWGPVITGVIFGYGPTLVQHLSTNAANAYPQILSSLLALILVVSAPDGLASLGAWARETRARAAGPTPFRGHAAPRLERPPSPRLVRGEDRGRLNRPVPEIAYSTGRHLGAGRVSRRSHASTS
jgi:sulfate-transporting ATPase